jgi:RNA polymerase sigma-70 factor, ECF subfamily
LLTLDGQSASIHSRLPAERNGEHVATPIRAYSPLAEHAAVSAVPSLGVTDAELVRTAQRGDRNSFGILYERYAAMVHGILLGRVPAHAVEDLVQDVFLKAMPRITSLRDPGHFGGWLAAIARNRAVDFFRQSNITPEQLEDMPYAEPKSAEAGSVKKNEAEFVLGAIRQLPEAYRETLILRLVEGMTGPEIALRTGLTHGSVRVNLHRGMQQLRQILEGREKPAVKR